jgi:hypothetical protein
VLASAGPFAVAVIAHVIAAVILLVLLRPDPLLASRDAAEEVAEPAAGWRGPQESALLAATCLDRSRRDGRVERRDGRRDDDDSYGWAEPRSRPPARPRQLAQPIHKTRRAEA